MASGAGLGGHPGRPPDPAAAAGPMGWPLFAAVLPQLVEAHHGLLYLVLQLLASAAPGLPLAGCSGVPPDQRDGACIYLHNALFGSPGAPPGARGSGPPARAPDQEDEGGWTRPRRPWRDAGSAPRAAPTLCKGDLGGPGRFAALASDLEEQEDREDEGGGEFVGSPEASMTLPKPTPGVARQRVRWLPLERLATDGSCMEASENLSDKQPEMQRGSPISPTLDGVTDQQRQDALPAPGDELLNMRRQLAEKETELAKAASSRDAAMRMLEVYKVENKVLLAKCEELAVRGTAGSEEESEEEEADGEEETAWHPGACTLCCGEFADTKEQAICVDGCGAMAHIACIKSKVNLGPNREYAALRGGWRDHGGGYVCPCCW